MAGKPRRRPRYADAVATLALVLALTSPAWADPVANGTASLVSTTKDALGFSKKANKTANKAAKTARKALRRANRALAEEGPQGPHGPQGAQGPQGGNGPQGAQGMPGSARAYARVFGGGPSSTGSGTVDEVNSLGIGDANVTREPPGTIVNRVYCVNGLSFTPKNAVATPEYPASADVVIQARASAATGADFENCPGPEQAIVIVYRIGTGQAHADANFYLALN
jgi:hypothetical protein